MSNEQKGYQFDFHLNPGESAIPIETEEGIEWWVFDHNGEWIEAYRSDINASEKEKQQLLAMRFECPQ